MNRRLLLFAFLLLGAGAIAFLYPRFSQLTTNTGMPIDFGQMITLQTTPTPAKEIKEVPYKLEAFTTGLEIPWSFVFTSDTRILVTERKGNIRAIVSGKVMEKPLITFSETAHVGESGLLGIELDPNYQSNKLVYVVMTYMKDGKMTEKVVRLKDMGETIVLDKIILDDIPAAQYHDGGALDFGPDGKLYISTGDATNKQLAQNTTSLAGKILRINSDGTIPEDNPTPSSAVYSLGHRNPQGFDWYPQSKVMWATEHGPSGSDGPGGGDEVNVIEPGENYGWPIVSHNNTKEGLYSPKIIFTPAVAPASGMFYSGNKFPQFKNNFFFGALTGRGVFRVVVDAKNPSQVVSYGKLSGIDVGRVRDIVQGPDGLIYFGTSNRDGRGTVQDGDDKIYRLVPTK